MFFELTSMWSYTVGPMIQAYYSNYPFYQNVLSVHVQKFDVYCVCCMFFSFFYLSFTELDDVAGNCNVPIWLLLDFCWNFFLSLFSCVVIKLLFIIFPCLL